MRDSDSKDFNLQKWYELQKVINANKVSIDKTVHQKTEEEKLKLKKEVLLYNSNVGRPLHEEGRKDILRRFLGSSMPKFNIDLKYV